MTPSFFQLPPPVEPSAALERAIAGALRLNSAQVHEIDFEDLMLKESVMKSIGSMAGELLRRFAGESAGAGDLASMAPIMKERAYWIEETRELVLAVSVADETHLIQVPREAWMVTERSCH